MKPKYEDGITLLSMIIALFMLTIISATIIHYSKSLSRTAKIENLKSNMILIEAQAKIISEKYNYDAESVTILGSSLDDGYYLLDSESLSNMGLEEIAKGLNSKEYYKVRYAIGEYKDNEILVEYEPGITYQGELYTTLSQIKEAGL